MKLKVAIQGVKGSFHHQVAKQYFGEDIYLHECSSFNELVKSLRNNSVDTAVMALENSIAGSILPNYALIDTNSIQITGEYYQDIHMNLMAMPGQKIEELKEVHSHPIALLQCEAFFSKYPHIKLVESEDTAETARRINKDGLRSVGAVAGPIAAELYGLEILAKGIHTIKDNKTRFAVLNVKNNGVEEEQVNKASLKFELDDTPGSLATVLNVMNNCKLNLTKIQSLPVIETPFKYSFFVDVVFENYAHYKKAKEILEIMTTHFKILGEYKKGNQ